MQAPEPLQGLVTASHGRHYSVECSDGQVRHCCPRGKRSEAAVGDHVTVQALSPEEGRITQILPRRNLLYRSDASRSKQFAANIDLLLVVTATEPQFSNELLGRALVAAHNEKIPTYILLNKVDLTALVAPALAQLEWVQALGVDVIQLSALDQTQTLAQLNPLLYNKTTLLLGQSAMGKSALLNALVPDAQALTKSHSLALGAGRHTTTNTRLYHLPHQPGCLIDSPGFQSFGLHHLDRTDLLHSFPEIEHAAHQCRFANCRHAKEPGCAVLQQVTTGEITAERYQLYTRLVAEYEARMQY